MSRRTAWVYWPFRVVVTVAAVLLFNQAVYAGQFLSGEYLALNTHQDNAAAASIAVVIATLSAVPIRWPGRGPWWPILACLGLFGLIALQSNLGSAGLLTLHIPLGVSIIVLAIALTIWGWRPHPTAEEADR